MGASVAAAVIVRREKELVALFRERGATTPATARTQSELGADNGVGWRRLTSRAVVRDAGDGRYYLDEPGWEALERGRHRLLAVVLFVIGLAALGWYLSSRG